MGKSLNVNQKYTLIVCCLFLFISVIFPPWEFVKPAVKVGYARQVPPTSSGSGTITISGNYKLIFHDYSDYITYTDSDNYAYGEIGIRIDFYRLFLEWAGILFLTIASLLLFSFKQPKSE